MVTRVIGGSAAVAFVVFASSACGSTPSRATLGASPVVPARATTPPGSGPVISGSIAVNGGEDLTTTFETRAERELGGSATAAPVGSTCAEYARGLTPDSGTFVAPELQTSGDITLYLRASITSGYRGPGVYTSRSTPSLGGTLVVGIGMGSAQSGAFTIFRSAINGTTTLQVNADGSGDLVITGWGSDEYKGGHDTVDISGSVTWTCR